MTDKMLPLALAISLTLLVSAAHRAPYNTSAARKRGALNVHLVPHTHDDVGWLKTVDSYYVGSNADIQRAGVRKILNAVFKELAWNPDRTFTYVESAFFERWWDEVDERTASVVRGLVASGQLQFANGAHSMADEACTSHADAINNAETGHRLLLDAFGVTPRTTWQVDPFGHSAFFGSVMASPASGMNAVFFMRADWQEIKARQANRTTEMIWAPSPTLGAGGSTYAGILYGGYCTVGGLSMDFFSDDAPIQDDARLEDVNVAAVVNATVATALDALSQVPQGGGGGDGTTDIMLLLGCDFEWENAGSWYDNTDKLIHHLNADSRVNAFYSTPSQYADAKLEAGRAYTLKTSDFFPYDFFPHGYLTGFFSSRPALKGYIRESSSLYHAAMQLQALSGGAADMGRANPLYRLERALGVAQHHDAVTGSSRQAVAYDYARRLAWGREDAELLVGAALARLLGAPTPLAACDLANATICAPLEAGAPAALLVYNQAAQPRDVAVRLPAGLPAGVAAWAVLDAAGAALPAQSRPLSAADAALRNDYYHHYPSPCDQLPGVWTDPAAHNEFPWSGSGGRADAYTLAWAPGAAGRNFTVVNTNDAADGWRTARGALAADNASVLLTFDTPGTPGNVTLVAGAVSAQCDAFFLANPSTWRLVASAQSARTTPDMQWLAFQVPAVPPLGYAVVFLQPAASAAGAPGTAAASRRALAGADAQLGNGLVNLTFSGETHLLSAYARGGGAPQRLAHYLAYYNSSNGTAAAPGGISGAYIFRPNSSTLFAPGYPAAAPPAVEFWEGPVLAEALSVYTPWASSEVRLWAGALAVELEHTVGPIPTADRDGKELVARYETDLASAGAFYTDSNGRDSVLRQRDKRADWNLTVEEPVAGNYYPVSSFIYLSDARSGATLSLAVDRAEGGASIVDGALELMLHRRLLLDDRLGVGEALTEPGVAQGNAGLAVRVTHLLSLEADAAAAARARRAAAAALHWRPLLRLAPLPPGADRAAWAAARRCTFSGLAAPLPASLHLLSAHATGPATLLLRLAHSFERGEGGAGASANVSVALAALFAPPLALRACTEMTVSGNQPLASAPRVTYNVSGGGATTLPIVPPPPQGGDLEVLLAALEIRTWQCDADFGGQPPIVLGA